MTITEMSIVERATLTEKEQNHAAFDVPVTEGVLWNQKSAASIADAAKAKALYAVVDDLRSDAAQFGIMRSMEMTQLSRHLTGRADKLTAELKAAGIERPQ